MEQRSSNKPQKQYARVSEVAEIFGFSASWWRERADAGDVDVRWINKQRVFELESCARFMREGKPARHVGAAPRQVVRSVTSKWRKGVVGGG